MAETVSSQQPTAIVTGGSRGLGRGIAQALVARGVHVIALARDAAGLEALARELANVEPVVADAADEIVAARLLQEKQPSLVVLCAGASALLRARARHSWVSFPLKWEVDAKSVCVWLLNAHL